MDEQYKVVLTSRAVRDVDGIYKYISETLSETQTALRLIDEIEKEILSLNIFPKRCAVRNVGIYANKGYRQLFVKNYTVIYRVDEEAKRVIVITVRYSASLF